MKIKNIIAQWYKMTFRECHVLEYYTIYFHLVDKNKMSRGEKGVFINKTAAGLNNLCGQNIARFRRELDISQRELADRMQLAGIDIDKNAIQRIECGKRFVTDIEVLAFAQVFGTSLDALLKDENAHS